MARIVTSEEIAAAYPTLADSDLDLADLAIQADGVLKARLKRKILAQESGAETFRLSSERQLLVCDEFPITAISSIVINGSTVSPSSYEIQGKSGIFREPGWPRGSKIAVSYTAGYASGSAEFSILRSAALKVALMLAQENGDPNSDTLDFGPQNKFKLGDFEVEGSKLSIAGGDSDRLPDPIERALKPFRRGPRVC